MTSPVEKFGRALGKAVKGAADVMNDKKSAPKMFRTNMRDVPKVEGLKREDGWVDMQVQFLIDKKIVTIPSEVRPTILETPPYARNGGFASMDTPGAYETKATEAFY